jgi:hypothetical protein
MGKRGRPSPHGGAPGGGRAGCRWPDREVQLDGAQHAERTEPAAGCRGGAGGRGVPEYSWAGGRVACPVAYPIQRVRRGGVFIGKTGEKRTQFSVDGDGVDGGGGVPDSAQECGDPRGGADEARQEGPGVPVSACSAACAGRVGDRSGLGGRMRTRFSAGGRAGVAVGRIGRWYQFQRGAAA